MSDDKRNRPMDPTAIEGDAPDMYVPAPRMPYAMEQLVQEVTALFPETAYELSNRNPRGVAFDVQFSDLPKDDGPDLLDLINEDPRIEEVLTDPEGVLVSFRNDVRTMDLRDPYGLADAYAVMTGGAL